ncbi:MAG: domain S-box [Geobacteraceae bacterium]|nr:domain S-box [Geobacteraceae bacterium]
MQDENKTKEQLLDELRALRARNNELEAEKLNLEPANDTWFHLPHDGFISAGHDITELKQTENALRESEEKLRLFFDHTPAAVAMLDKNMKYIHTSRRWVKDYGLGERNIIGLSHYEVFPEIPDRWREIHQRCLAGAIEKCEEDPFTRLDGKTDWVRWEIHPWRDNNGNIGGIIMFTEVITERKRVEEALQKSNQRLDLLAETAGMLLESDSPQEVIDSLCRKVLAYLECDSFFNYIVDYERHRLHLNACGGIPDKDVQKMEWLDYGVGLCGCSARDGIRLVVENLQGMEDQYTALVRPFGIQAYACHPLISQGRVLGTLSFCTRTKSHFTENELSLMKSVAEQVAIAIDRKLSSERTSRSEKKFREIFENARDAIFLMNEDSSVLDCNPAASALFKCEKIRLVGEKLYDFSPSVQPDGSGSKTKAAGFLNSVLQDITQCFEWVYLRPNGSQFEASVVVNSFELDGTLTMLAILRDISDRKRTEEALRESETRFRALVETTSDWIWEVDKDEIYTYSSPKVHDYLGYTPTEVSGKTLYDFMVPEGIPNIRNKFNACKEERRPFLALEKESLHKNGNIVIIETSGVPVFDKDGIFSGYRGIDRNITERKMLEQKFLQAQKMEAVGQLANGIAHDFNNIIMAIKGYVNLLLPRMDCHPEGSQFMKRMGALAERAGTLTQDLLAFSRKKGFKPQPNDLNLIVKRMKNILRWLIGDEIAFKMSLHRGVLLIMAVSGQIEQLLINVVTNARDATPEGGLITVSTSFVDRDSVLFKPDEYADVGDYALLSISDTGIGMDNMTRLKIFEPFFTLKEVGKGTGLGLAVVYGVVKHHGGFINVSSKQGGGTTFNIYIPLIDVGRENTTGFPSTDPKEEEQ